MKEESEDNRSNKEVNVSEVRYRRLFEAARDGILILDADTGKIIDVNPYLIEKLEYTKEEFIDKKLWGIGPFKDIFASKISFKELQDKGYIRYDNLPLETKNGKILEFEFISNVYQEGIRKVIQCNIRDNSARKKPEKLKKDPQLQEEQKQELKLQQLKIFNKQLNNVINAISNPIFVKDDKSIFILANDALCKILGIERKNIIGKTLGESLPEDQMEHLLEVDKMVIESGQENICEEPLTGYDGKILTIVTRKTRYSNEQGSRFLVGIIHDITAHKRLEMKVMQAQKMESIGTLAGGIAHDFNNLLTVIMGNASIALLSIDKTSKAFDNLNQINLTAKRAATLTKQLLLYSRKQPIVLNLLNLNKTIVDVLKMIKRLIGEDIKIKLELDPDIGTVMADESTIEQVITNLCVNSRDAMPEGGTLTIKSETVVISDEQNKYEDLKPGNYIRLSVADTGIGMEKETIKHIFEPFYTTKRIGKGTGLGLSVAYGIVKEHNGWINVYSEPSKGTVISVYLPSIIKKVETRSEAVVEANNLRGKGENILLIEDDKDIIALMKIYLNENGYNPYIAENSEQAVRIFTAKEKEIDLIISDMILPGKTGLEIVEQLRLIKNDIPAIFSSGYLEDKSKYSEMGGKDYGFIQKPFEINELLKLIKEKLQKRSKTKKSLIA